jgi:hypothetical protein
MFGFPFLGRLPWHFVDLGDLARVADPVTAKFMRVLEFRDYLCRLNTNASSCCKCNEIAQFRTGALFHSTTPATRPWEAIPSNYLRSVGDELHVEGLE